MGVVSGIIAEFNPFHNGHAYLIAEAKRNSDAMICVMSGSFVQRGEPALLPKSVRAAAALECGADLVLELPAPYSLSGARNFARGGISLLAAAGVVDTIVFGSECGDLSLLRRASDAERHPEFRALLKQAVAGGISYAVARQQAIGQIDPAAAELLASPNDILASEYLSAAEEFQYAPKFIAVKRRGAAHDSALQQGNYASASALRASFSENAFPGFVPKSAEIRYLEAKKQGHYTDRNRFELAAAALLRGADLERFQALPDLSEGLENALFRAAKSGGSFSEIAELAKSKRYPLARIRRLLCCACLKIEKGLTENRAPYLRVLGMTEKGEALVRSIAKQSALPIVTQHSEIKKLTGAGKAVFAAEAAATDLLSFCLHCPLPAGADYTDRLIRIKGESSCL